MQSVSGPGITSIDMLLEAYHMGYCHATGLAYIPPDDAALASILAMVRIKWVGLSLGARDEGLGASNEGAPPPSPKPQVPSPDLTRQIAYGIAPLPSAKRKEEDT